MRKVYRKKGIAQAVIFLDRQKKNLLLSMIFLILSLILSLSYFTFSMVSVGYHLSKEKEELAKIDSKNAFLESKLSSQKYQIDFKDSQRLVKITHMAYLDGGTSKLVYNDKRR